MKGGANLSVCPAVVVDRREDKDCDIGKFELAFKQVRTIIVYYL